MRNSNPSSLRLLWLALAALLVLAALSLTYQTAQANIGPKPTLHFDFTFPAGDDLEITRGELVQCRQPDCSDAVPFLSFVYNRFECEPASCSAMGMFLSPYLQLEITFSDGSWLQSNIFSKTKAVNSSYNVQVTGSSLVVKERYLPNILNLAFWAGLYGSFGLLLACIFNFIPLASLFLLAWLARRARRDRAYLVDSQPLFVSAWVFWVPAAFFGGYAPALPLTILIEGTLAYFYARAQRLPQLGVITAVALLDVLTLSALWQVVKAAPDHGWAVLLAGEVVVWLVEAAGLKFVLGPKISLRQAAILSSLINAASFLVGLVLPLG